MEWNFRQNGELSLIININKQQQTTRFNAPLAVHNNGSVVVSLFSSIMEFLLQRNELSVLCCYETKKKINE